MAQDANRFTVDTKTKLSQRASTTCSNPHCRDRTHGPTESDEGIVMVGVAAHIRGANPGSARYDESMMPHERSSITNGIWLCSKCAKLVDDDEVTFTVQVLLDWKREHEEEIRTQIGYPPGKKEAITRIRVAFANESNAVLQIAIDKPANWEWLIIIQMLRDRSTEARGKHDLLQRGLLYRPANMILLQETPYWMQRKVRDLDAIVHMLAEIVNHELPKGIGESGVPGDEMQILAAMNLMSTAFAALVDWDLDTKSTLWDDNVDHLREYWFNITPQILNQLERLPNEVEYRLDQYEKTGRNSEETIQCTITMPEGIEQSIRTLLLAVNKISSSLGDKE